MINVLVFITRTHSSMLMQTARLLGVPCPGSFRPTLINGRGNGEDQETTEGIDTSKYEDGVCKKVMATVFLYNSKVGPTDRIIIPVRPPTPTIESQLKAQIGILDPEVRRYNYWRALHHLIRWSERNPNPILWMDTEAMLRDPAPWVKRMADFLGVPVTPEAVANIEPSMTSLGAEEPDDDAGRIYREARVLCYAST